MRKVIATTLGALLFVGMLSAVATAQESDTDTAVPERVSVLDSALDELVQEGVITQAQADTIAERLASAHRAFRGSRVGHLETVAEVLDMTVDDLRASLQGGSSIADVAGDQAQAVIDALVAEHQARLDQAVEDGRIDADTAAEKATEIVERVTAMVNGELPEGGPGFGHRGHGRRGFGDGFGPGLDTEGTDDAATTSA
jgi:ribosomal protein S20